MKSSKRPGPAKSSWRRCCAAVTGCFGLVLILGVSPVIAQTPVSGGEASAAGVPGIEILDGMRFRGPAGMQGKSPRREDTFIFNNGRFISENCKQQGFTPDVYWVRRDQGAILFRAELVSPDYGTIAYRGRIKDQTIEATFVWNKQRWYWNVEREFWFKGKLVKD